MPTMEVVSYINRSGQVCWSPVQPDEDVIPVGDQCLVFPASSEFSETEYVAPTLTDLLILPRDGAELRPPSYDVTDHERTSHRFSSIDEAFGALASARTGLREMHKKAAEHAEQAGPDEGIFAKDGE